MVGAVGIRLTVMGEPGGAAMTTRTCSLTSIRYLHQDHQGPVFLVTLGCPRHLPLGYWMELLRVTPWQVQGGVVQTAAAAAVAALAP